MKRKVIKMLTVTIMASTLALTGCGREEAVKEVEQVTVSDAVEDTVKKEVAEEETLTEATEDQKKAIEEVLPAIKERFVLEKAKNVDLASGFAQDADLIKEVEVLQTDMEPDKVGTYEVTYKVTADAEALQAKVEEVTGQKEKEHSVNEEVQIVVLTIQENVSVVTDDVAKKLSEEGKEVLTDNGDVFAPEKKEEKKESKEKDTEKTPAKTETKKENAEVSDKKETAGAKPSTGTAASEQKEPDKKTEQNQSASQAASKPSAETKPAVTPSGSKTPSSQESHTHTWVAQKKTIHHDAQYELVYVVDKPAWDEDIYVDQAVYTTIPAVRCGCGAEFSNYDEWCAHEEYYGDVVKDYSHGSYSVVYNQIQTGTEKVYVRTERHPEEGHMESKTAKDAYDEEVVTGYKCSGCGATK